jgi:hypothetical protein
MFRHHRSEKKNTESCFKFETPYLTEENIHDLHMIVKKGLHPSITFNPQKGKFIYKFEEINNDQHDNVYYDFPYSKKNMTKHMKNIMALLDVLKGYFDDCDLEILRKLHPYMFIDEDEHEHKLPLYKGLTRLSNCDDYRISYRYHYRNDLIKIIEKANSQKV